MVRRWFAPPDLDGEPFGTAWKKLTLTWGYFWGGCLVACVAVFDIVQNRPGLALLETGYMASLFVASVVMMRTGRFFQLFSWTGMVGMMVFPNLASFLAGGFFGSGGRGVWAFTAPMMSALLLPDWCTAVFFLAFMGLLGVSLYVPGPFEPYSADALPFLFQFHMIGLFLTTFAVFIVFFRKMQWQNATLRRQEIERKEIAVKSGILSVLSHEIRTPLNAIIGLLDLVSVEPLPPGARENVATIQNASRNLHALATDVLDYSKIVDGKLALERLPTDVGAVLRGVVEAQRVVACGSGTALDLSCPPSWVEGDPTRLAQIATNLVSNAVKFSPGGRVRVEASSRDGWLSIVVRDTGVGIAPENLGRIFTPFSQAESSISRRFGGTGLGLAIVRGIVATAGGSIEVESREGEGSAFAVRLPWPEARPGGSEGPEEELRPWDVLVVDDNAVNLRVAGRLLEKLGMRACCVGGGPEALDWLSRNDCDLVFMDLQMPGMDGYEAARRIRDDISRQTPVVALSAEVLDASHERLRESGMRGFLGKPINLDRLRGCIATLQSGAPRGPVHGFLLLPSDAFRDGPARR